MPFPLAHPAAVLPLRRWCPHRLSFASLVIGSLIPDVTNCLNWDHYSHSLMGSLFICWPLGLVLLRVFLRTRAALVATLPNPHREALLPLCGEPGHSLIVQAMSLLLGIWIHIGWDLFTHDHSWLAQSLGTMSIELPKLGTHELKVNRVLWLLSTGGGVTIVLVAYLLWLRRATERVAGACWEGWRPYTTWSGLLLLPVLASTPLTLLVSRGHDQFGYMMRAFVEFYLTLLLITLAIAGFVFRARGLDRRGKLN